MAHNPINFTLQRRWITDMVSYNPVHVQNYILIAGDGFGTLNSYQFTASYVGALATQGRDVFRDAADTAAVSAATKNFVLIIPYATGITVPTRKSYIQIFRMDGTSIGRFWVNFVKVWSADTPNVNQDTGFAIEIHLVEIQG